MNTLSLIMIFMALFITFSLFLIPSRAFHLRGSFLLAIGFLTIGIVGNFLWELFRVPTDVGYLGNVSLSEEQKGVSQQVMFAISIGVFIGALIAHSIQDSKSKVKISGDHQKHDRFEFELSKSQLRAWILLGIVLISVYLIGTGSTFWYNTEYLYISGNQFAYKVANLALLPWTVITTFVSVVLKSSYSKSLLTMNVAIFVLFLGEGSRQSVIVFLSWVIFRVIKKRNKFTPITLALDFFFMLLIFHITQLFRSYELGISQIPKVLSVIDYFSIDIYLLAVSRLFQSVFNWWVTIPLSVNIGDASLVLRNLNPMFGVGNEAYSFSSDGVERIYPYSWNPASTAGQIFGAFGFLSIVLIFVLMSFIANMAVRDLFQTSGVTRVAAFSVCAMFFIQLVFFLQYSSRIWSRTAQLLILSYFIFRALRKRSAIKNETH